MAYETILYDRGAGVATITLNRPDRMNALIDKMSAEILDALQAAENDESVRVVILTGAGRGFCAGADMDALNSITDFDVAGANPAELKRRFVPEHERPEAHPAFRKTYSYFPSIEKPIIAAINGAAVGLGFVLTLYCDIRLASEEARFSTAFSRRGLIAEHGISWMLPRLVGVANALDLLYSARLIDASEAQRMGLVNRVVEHDKLLETVNAYAGELATMVSPRSLRVIKKQVYEALFQDLDVAIDAANEAMFASFATEDFKEGVAHFVEKRPPRFSGK